MANLILRILTGRSLHLLLVSGCLLLSSVGAFASIEVAFERNTDLPLIHLHIAIRHGAISDPPGQSGLTNLTGEMLLRGTRSRTKDQFDRALNQIGAQLLVETRTESQVIRGAVLSSEFETFLQLLSEILTEPRFAEADLKKLKAEVVSVIQEELGHDARLAQRKFNQFLFEGHPYGNPILGTVEDILKVTQEQIQNHYQRLLHDDALIIVGSGDALPAQVERWADALSDKLKARGTRDKSLFTEVSLPKGPEKRRLLIIDKPERTQTQINVGQIGIRMTDSQFFPLQIANHAFGGHSFSATLMKEIRVKRGWSYGASSNFRYGLQPRSWQVHLFPAAKDTPQALTLTLSMLEDLKRNGITQEQFEFAQRSLINSSGFLYNTPAKRMENRILEKTLSLPNGYIQSFRSQLSKVTYLDAKKAVQQFVRPQELAITVVATAEQMLAPLSQAAGVPLEEVKVQRYAD